MLYYYSQYDTIIYTVRSILQSYLTLPLIHQHLGRILHITDTHLFDKDQGTLLGIHSNKSFVAVMDEIEKHSSRFDLIVATGDFVQDGSKKGYQRFAERIIKFDAPCVWLAGNHDNFQLMQSTFNSYHLAENKVVLLGDNWIIILLHSQVVGQAYGFLAPSELNFLQKVLHDNPARSAIVFLHHHPIISGCDWLDKHALKNSNDLEHIIQSHSQIKGLGYGHIHQQQDNMWHTCQVFSTPSTCVQFKPNCHNFTLSDVDSPGWREISLTVEGKVESVVQRIDNHLFLPDMSQGGYE